jgi:Uma2 family endonuclease
MTPTVVLDPIPALTPAAFDDEALFEIINGERVELQMSAYAVRVAFNIARRLANFAESKNIGEAVGEVLFHLPLERKRIRRPDAAFVSYQRWAKDRPMPLAGNAWEVAPDLAVEVVSPTDLIEEVMDKLAEYFQAGVRLVWVVYPRLRMIQVYESLTQTSILTSADELDGGNVLPGFRTPVAVLFPETAPPA